MAERSNAAVLKTVVCVSGPGVRIPLSPPATKNLTVVPYKTNIMRKILFICSCMLFSIFGFAQKHGLQQVMIEPRILVLAGPGLDIGLGDFSDTHSIGLSG